MGYYTRFNLEIRSEITKKTAEEIVKSINDKIGFKCFTLYVPSYIEDTDTVSWDIEAFDEMKWYEWENDMDEIAAQYPDIEFRIEGNGDDKEDWWIALYKGKRKQIKYATPPIDHWED